MWFWHHIHRIIKWESIFWYLGNIRRYYLPQGKIGLLPITFSQLLFIYNPLTWTNPIRLRSYEVWGIQWGMERRGTPTWNQTSNSWMFPVVQYERIPPALYTTLASIFIGYSLSFAHIDIDHKAIGVRLDLGEKNMVEFWWIYCQQIKLKIR